MPTCKTCGQVLSCEKRLRYHIEHRVCDKRLARKKRLTCPFCMYIFSSKQKLKQHIEKRICQTAQTNTPQEPPSNPTETKNVAKGSDSTEDSTPVQTKKRKYQSISSPKYESNPPNITKADNSSEQKISPEPDNKRPFWFYIVPEEPTLKNVSRVEDLMIFLESLCYLENASSCGQSCGQISFGNVKTIFVNCVNHLSHDHPLYQLYAEYKALVDDQPSWRTECNVPNLAPGLCGRQLTLYCVGVVSNFVHNLKRKHFHLSRSDFKQYVDTTWKLSVSKIREEMGSDSFEQRYKQDTKKSFTQK